MGINKPHRFIYLLIVLGIGILGPTVGWAEVTLRGVEWQARSAAKSAAYQSTEHWIQPPAAGITGKLKAVVTLSNQGLAPAEGVLLRYAVTARLAKIKNTSDEGTWVVPFWEEDHRIPLLKANQTKEVSMDISNARLQAALKAAWRAGFWPKALKIQVMVEPKAGEDLENRILEKTLSVEWQLPAK